MLWEDGQVPSDSYGGFLASSRKMVMSRTEYFWSALGRWSGPIRRLWSISGLFQEDGQVQYCGFLEYSGKMVRPHQTAVDDFWLVPGQWSGPPVQWIFGVLWKDDQPPSDSYGGFLACMVMSRTEDFWSALGRCSGPIRQLWRIAGLLQENGHVQYPVLCGFLEFSGKVDCQAPSDSFLEFFGKLVIPIPFHCNSLLCSVTES